MDSNSASPQKRRQFSLEFKMRAIGAVEAGVSKGTLAKELCVSPSTLSTFLMDRAKIEAGIVCNSLGPKRQRARLIDFQDVDRAVFTWICEVRSRNLPLSGPIVQKKALAFASSLGFPDFTASNGGPTIPSHYLVT